MALEFYIRAAGESTAVLCGTFLRGDCNPGEEVLIAAKGLYEERIVFFVGWQQCNPIHFPLKSLHKNKTTEPVFERPTAEPRRSLSEEGQLWTRREQENNNWQIDEEVVQ